MSIEMAELPPQWIPGMELKAQHLQSLENYLLRSRHSGSILEDWGIAKLEFGSDGLGVAALPDGRVELSLRGLQGVTRSGYPINVPKLGRALTCVIPTVSEISLQLEIILSVSGKPSELPVTIGGVTDGSRLSEYEVPRTLDLALRQPGDLLTEDMLSLGLYELTRSTGERQPHLRVVQWPRMQYLGAFSPEPWADWTRPLRRRLFEVILICRGAPALLTVVATLEYVAISWPTWPVAELAIELSRLDALIAWLNSGNPGVEGPLPLMSVPQLDDVLAHDIPIFLAELLHLPKVVLGRSSVEDVLLPAAPPSPQPTRRASATIHWEPAGQFLTIWPNENLAKGVKCRLDVVSAQMAGSTEVEIIYPEHNLWDTVRAVESDGHASWVFVLSKSVNRGSKLEVKGACLVPDPKLYTLHVG